MDKKIRIVLTDTNEEARSMLQEALERSRRFEVTGSTGDGAEALRLVQETKPDLLVLDMILPSLDGMGILRRLDRKDRPQILASPTWSTSRWWRTPGNWARPCSSASPTTRRPWWRT